MAEVAGTFGSGAAAVQERRVYLSIWARSLGESLIFILPEKFTDGYENDLKGNADEKRTHPAQHLWEKGRVQDLNLELRLVVGISPRIVVPEDLKRMVETLRTMALPIRPRVNYLESVRVTISAMGNTWFSRNYFVSKVETDFETPVDIQTGLALSATVRLELTPTYTPLGAPSFEPVGVEALPKRPFTFIDAR